MKIRSYRTLENGVYMVSLNTEDWSEGDKNLMAFYGEPSIDLGETFVSAGSAPDYTLPVVYVRIMSEMPVKQGFDSRDHVDAESMALTWESTIISRIDAAVTTLRASQDTFTNESVTTI